MPNLLFCSASNAKHINQTRCRTGNQADQSVVTAKGFDELSAHWESTVPQLSALPDCGELPTPQQLYLGDVWSDWGR
jgi:hypothetical protein